MLIKEFTATDVFGYLNFNIYFNRDKNFLVGGNGSGKTTALKLMNALVTPNFRDLITIPFKRCSLLLEVEGEDINICASMEGDFVYLYVDKLNAKKVKLPLISDTELDFISERESRFEEIIKELIRKYSSHAVVESISKIPSPVFLGLDRRTDFLESKSDYFLERKISLSNNRKAIMRARRMIENSMGVSLMEIEMLVKNTYRRIRDLEVQQSEKLRDQLLVSSFKYVKFDAENLFGDKLKSTERKLLERKNEVKKALSNIISNNSLINEEVDTFFKNLNDLYDGMSSDKNYANIELLLNKAQIDRVYSIVEIIDEHKSKNDEYYKPINDFLNTINSFYQDSGKKLEVDTVGQLVVKRPDGKVCTIEGLSSGERQLLIIFAHSYFNQNNIFIIDEPEISLHLGWQEKLVDAIFSSNPESQFILATHSPEIVAGNEDKAVECR